MQEITEQKLFAQELSKQVRKRTKELEMAHDQLLAANDYLQNIINVFNMPLQVLQPVMKKGQLVDFIYKMTNSAYAAYANKDPEALQNKKISDFFPGYFQTESFIKIAETYKTGLPNTWENHYNVDGMDIYNEMSATKMQEEVVVHFTDFTRLKNLQVELMRKIEELERSNHNLEEFAYAVSHDLKEPIRKIHFFSDRLKSSLEDRMTPEERASFERMEIASKRMGSLIDDLLSYSQVSLRPRLFEQVDLNQIMDLVLSDLDLEIAQKHAKINIDKLCIITGHHRQLQQAFQKLVSNSLKYSKPDTAPEIKISSLQINGKDLPGNVKIEEVGNAFCHIILSDNGFGFEQRDADRIFNLFARLHGNREYKGTGIGLSIVRKVIQNHNGHISAQGKPGDGAVFNIYLPLRNTLVQREA
ncbi:MAG: hypothetical protein NVSMB67_19680 [Flavisolibacter sp.]